MRGQFLRQENIYSEYMFFFLLFQTRSQYWSQSNFILFLIQKKKFIIIACKQIDLSLSLSLCISPQHTQHIGMLTKVVGIFFHFISFHSMLLMIINKKPKWKESKYLFKKSANNVCVCIAFFFISFFSFDWKMK